MPVSTARDYRVGVGLEVRNRYHKHFIVQPYDYRGFPEYRSLECTSLNASGHGHADGVELMS
jgi:hypothetical protein